MASEATLALRYLSNSDRVFSTSPLGRSRSKNILKLGLALISMSQALSLVSSSTSKPTMWKFLAYS